MKQVLLNNKFIEEIKNPSSVFNMYLNMRDSCIDQYLYDIKYIDICKEHPLVPAKNMLDDGFISSDQLTSEFALNLCNRTISICTTDAITMKMAAEQIEDQAYLKLTATLKE